MARMLGAAGFAGSGCSSRCRRTHTPRPKHETGAMRVQERRRWLADWADDVDRAWYERHGIGWLYK